MTPEEQGAACFYELGQMLQEAQTGIRFRAGNEDTLVVNGLLTTLVGKSPQAFQDDL